jgi:SAM-dependent methyltransferase
MTIGYRLAYAVGATPWERAGEQGAEALEKMIARAEDDLGGPGRALDLGCGTGMHLVTLARRGWDATGVDAIPRAVRLAEQRAAAAGVAVRVVRGDVTDLDTDAIGDGYRLLLDIGCFHGLDDQQRVRMGQSVNRIAGADAVMILLAFRPGVVHKPLPRGADTADLERAFRGWRVVDIDPAPTDGMPKPLRKAAPAFYVLRRRG